MATTIMASGHKVMSYYPGETWYDCLLYEFLCESNLVPFTTPLRQKKRKMCFSGAYCFEGVKKHNQHFWKKLFPKCAPPFGRAGRVKRRLEIKAKFWDGWLKKPWPKDPRLSYRII